jgi:hypothetical protein
MLLHHRLSGSAVVYRRVPPPLKTLKLESAARPGGSRAQWEMLGLAHLSVFTGKCGPMQRFSWSNCLLEGEAMRCPSGLMVLTREF